MDMIMCYKTRNSDMLQRCLTAAVLISVLLINNVSVSSAQSSGLCSTTERSTVTYKTTYQVSRSVKQYRKCGFFNWGRCTEYRVGYSIEDGVAYRDLYNIVLVCCNGWEKEADGSCIQTTTEPATSQSGLTGTVLAPNTNITTPIEILSSSLPTSYSSSTASAPPAEVAQPVDVSSNTDSLSFLENKEMLGVIGGVAAALVVMVLLMVLFVSKRRRRSREKKRSENEPGVMFELLTSNSPTQGPTPDIYTEIPDRQTNANSTVPEPETGQGDNDDYDLAFIHSQQPSGRANTYQDVKDISNSCYASMEPKQTVDRQEVATPKKATESPVGMKVDVEVRLDLGQNGSAYTTSDHKDKCKKEAVQYQNMDVVIKAPEIYDTSISDTSYNKLDKTNVKHVVPTDPEDEAYNTVIIGPTRSERAPYDRLDRQKVSRLSSEDQLDVSIPAAPGYAALGAKDANLAYDKLERHEAHSVDPDRKAGTSEPNTYNELGAMGRQKNYDKLTRQHSGDRCLKDPSKISDETPRSKDVCDNEYDTVVIGSPAPQAGGEIYQNLPKKPHENGLKTKVASPDSKHHKKDLNHRNPQKASPVVRPLYDVIPGSPRAFSAPVYDTLPNSPRGTGTAPVYDTPPACHPMNHQESCEDHASPGMRGARPVYDTPPVRLDDTCPLKFEETCPVYENTPTPRKGSTCI